MPLNQGEILDAAMALLDEVGVDELTTRRLGGTLGVRAGALYWHFPSKQALLDALAGRVVQTLATDPLPDGDWTCRVTTLASWLRAAMLAHRDGARLIATMSAPVEPASAFYTRLIRVLSDAGAEVDSAVAGADTVTSYVNGYTLEEQARQLARPQAGRDAMFATGLRVLVSGLRTELM